MKLFSHKHNPLTEDAFGKHGIHSTVTLSIYPFTHIQSPEISSNPSLQIHLPLSSTERSLHGTSSQVPSILIFIQEHPSGLNYKFFKQ